MTKIKVIGLIPSRIGSTRLPQKALLPINNLPLIIHTYRRAKLAKKLDDVIICCDDYKIFSIAQKFKAKAVLTSKKHKNGTERIYEAYNTIKKKYDLVVDIQGDEPLVSPIHIDKVISFHKANFKYEIILPTIKLKSHINQNLVKVITNMNDEVLYLSRAEIPFEHKDKKKFMNKHLSIISFKPGALKRFALNKETPLEKIEDIELLRALEINIKIKTVKLQGDIFSVDVLADYLNAKKKMPNDKFFKKYKKS